MMTVNMLEKTIGNLKSVRKFSVLTAILSQKTLGTPTNTQILTLLHSLWHQNLPASQKRLFAQDLRKIESYIRESFDSHQTRSLVIFSSGDNLWETLEFEFPLEPMLLIDTAPYLESIKKALFEHRRYMVILADREKARLFTVYLGEIEEHRDFVDNIVPQKVKAKKDQTSRDDKIFRHIEDHLRQHLKLISQAASSFARDKNISFLIIGGHKEMISKIKKGLPLRLKKIVKGEFVTELNIPIVDIYLKSKKIASGI